MQKPLTKAQLEAKERREELRQAGIPRRGRKSASELAAEAAAKESKREPELQMGAFVSRSETTFNRGRRANPIEQFETESQDLSGFSIASRASGDLNVALGMDRKTDIIGPDFNGALGPIWNQIDDVNSEQLQLLKSVYGVTSREQLVKKLQEQMGLRKKETHPLLKYRQASFIHGLTTNHYPCSFSRYAFPAEGNIKSTI